MRKNLPIPDSQKEEPDSKEETSDNEEKISDEKETSDEEEDNLVIVIKEVLRTGLIRNTGRKFIEDYLKGRITIEDGLI